MSELLHRLHRLHDRRDNLAREWAAGGGKVVAYTCDNFPHELVAAAGMLPFRLRGDPTRPNPYVDRYIAPDRQPSIKAPAFVDAMLEPLIAGRHEFVDYMVVAHGRKAIESSYESLTRAREGSIPMQDVKLFYLDKSWLPGEASSVFDRGCLLALKAQLEEWGETQITDASLAEAASAVERGRVLLSRLNRLRLDTPPRLAGSDALLVYSLAGAMPRAEHSRLVEELLDQASALPRRAGPRIYVSGSPQSTTALYRLVESLGATVVAEDHCWGERVAGCAPTSGPSALEGLAQRYHETPVCSIEFPLDRAIARWRASIRRARPDGVLFHVVSGDDLHVWDTPDKTALLAGERIPSLHLGLDGYSVAGKQLQELSDTISTWLGQL